MSSATDGQALPELRRAHDRTLLLRVRRRRRGRNLRRMPLVALPRCALLPPLRHRGRLGTHHCNRRATHPLPRSCRGASPRSHSSRSSRLLAGQRFGGTRNPAAPPAASGDAPFASAATPTGGARAPDISSLSPRERADRLYDRVMRLSSEGKTDSVQFFAPMALSVYQSLGPLDADLRYDFGRVAEVVGATEIARAQADSILASDSDPPARPRTRRPRRAAPAATPLPARGFARRLLAAEPSESAKGLPEYQRHQGDILEALAEARRK